MIRNKYDQVKYIMENKGGCHDIKCNDCFMYEVDYSCSKLSERSERVIIAKDFIEIYENKYKRLKEAL